MEHAYFDDEHKSTYPWPLGGDDERERWLWDFGYLEDTDETNKMAVFHSTLINTIFDYIGKDLTDWDSQYFDGLVVQYYSHWSCVDTTVLYLNAKRDELKAGATGEGVAALPVVIDELGNRQRLDCWDRRFDCYACDKSLEYETGWSRIRVLDEPEREPELIYTQAAETARKLISFSAKNQDGSGNNIRGVMWEWMMKPRGNPSDKCEIVQGCGRTTQLPGYRYPAFDAYRFFVHMINRLMILPVEYDIISSNGSIMLVKAQFSGVGGIVTAYWGYDKDDVFKEDIGSVMILISAPDGYEWANQYNAVGEDKGAVTVNGNGKVLVKLDTSPRYLSWGKQIPDFPADNVENFSEVAFLLNHSLPGGAVVINKFDSEDVEVGEIITPLAPYTDMGGLAWTALSGMLLVSCNTSSEEPRVLMFDGLDGTYDEDDDIKLYELDITNKEIYGIATDVVKIDNKETDLIYTLVKKVANGTTYWLDAYYHNGTVWVKNVEHSVEITGLFSGEEPKQVRTGVYWDWDPLEEEGEFKQAVYVSTDHRVLYSTVVVNEEPPYTYLDEFDDFTESDTGCDYNGFGFALDGQLYVADGGTNNRIRKYVIERASNPPYGNPSDIISLGADVPTGLRTTPFGTLGITMNVAGGGYKVVEYVNDGGGDYTISREIATGESTELIPNDLEYSYNR